MWPFKTPKPAKPAPPSPADELEPTALQRLRALESQFQVLQQEWYDTLDKIGRHFARAAAREKQRVHRDLGALETAEDAPGPTNGEGGGPIPMHDRKAALRAAVNAKRLGRTG